ncbi:MAG: hypothetical protein M3310_01095 [Actinomycetota bacterium]|nr:hypothetical protein [Actinomycetota bacterium]
MRATASVVTLLALFAAAVTGPAPAAAAESAAPCWKRLLDDWQRDGRVDGVYPAGCYEEALKRVPEDVRAYSSFPDDVKRARQEMLRVRRLQNADRASEPESAGDAPATGTADARRVLEREPETGPRDEGPIDSALNRLGSKDADSVPLPLLVLAGLAAGLLVVGGAGVAHQRLRGRGRGGNPS